MPDQRPHVGGQVVQGSGLAGHHVGVEIRRPSHRLAGVVDDEIQPLPRGQQLVAERLHAGRVAQVQPVDLQPVSPLGEVRLLRIACGGVARKARGHDQLGAGAQQLQAGLVADLHAPAGEQRHAPVQIRRFAALGVVERRAVRAQLVVEKMDQRVLLLAHVAVPGLDRFTRLRGVGLWRYVMRRETLRREHVGRAEHRLAPQRADAGLVEHGVLRADFLGVARLFGGLQLHPPCRRVGVIHRSYRLQQALALGGRQQLKQLPVGGQGFQRAHCRAQALRETGIRVRVGGRQRCAGG